MKPSRACKDDECVNERPCLTRQLHSASSLLQHATRHLSLCLGVASKRLTVSWDALNETICRSEDGQHDKLSPPATNGSKYSLLSFQWLIRQRAVAIRM